MAHAIQGYEGVEHLEVLRAGSGPGGTSETARVSTSAGAWRWTVAAGTGSRRFPVETLASGLRSGTTGYNYSWLSFHVWIDALPGAGQYYYQASGYNISAALRM